MKQSIIKDKSKAFALTVIKLYQHLIMNAPVREYIMSKQVLRSGTSIGANVKEALRGQSRADFRSKMNIALKELIKMLTNIVKSAEQPITVNCELNNAQPKL
jgi:four helix bundle protein